MKKHIAYLTLLFMLMAAQSFAWWTPAPGGSTSGGAVEDAAYGAGWNGDTTNAPSQNAVYDKIAVMPATAGDHLDLTGTDIDLAATAYTHIKTFTLESPAASDSFYFFKTPNAITLTAVTCIILGSTSATLDLNLCSSAGASCSSVVTPAACDSDSAALTIGTAAAASGQIYRVDVDSISGTPDSVTLHVRYTIDDGAE